MKGNRILRISILSLACLGMMMPQTNIFAAVKTKEAVAKPFVNGRSTIDVKLGQNGTFVGKVVDSQGNVVEGAAVSVRKGKKEIVKTTTNAKGEFGVKNMTGGKYMVVAGQGVRNFRLWSAKVAPPKARATALLVSDTQIVRGQPVLGGIDIITGALLATSTTAMIFAIMNNGDIDDLQGDVKMLKEQVSDLETDVADVKSEVDDLVDEIDDIQTQLDEIEAIVTP